MTLEEMQDRIKILDADRRRWRGRAMRILDAIEERDPEWAQRIHSRWLEPRLEQ